MIKEIGKIIQNNTSKEQSGISKKPTTTPTSVKMDSVSISSEAKKIYKENILLLQNVLSSKQINRDPLFRKEKVDEAKQQLNTSFYDNKTDDTVNLILLDLLA